MPQKKMTITTTHGQGLYEFTSEAERFVKEAGVDEGLLTVFVRHTSCSLLIQENADPDVRRDLAVFFPASCHLPTMSPCAGSSTRSKALMTCLLTSNRP